MLFRSVAFDARAQQCDVLKETITKLFHPEIATYTVWDTMVGEGQKYERYKGVVSHGDGVLAVGEMLRLEGVAPVIFVTRFDRRGRVDWSMFHPVSGLSEVVDVQPYGKADAAGQTGVVVVGNIQKSGQRSAFWVGFFDQKGKLIRQNIIRDPNFDLSASDLQLQVDGDGVLVPVSASYVLGGGALETIRHNAMIYILDKNGLEVMSRSYVLGDKNQLSRLSVLKKDGEFAGYIATGWFESSPGKMNGWLLRLSKGLSMVWQKEFSRGKSAKLYETITDKNGYIIVSAAVDAMDDRPMATWVASIRADDSRLMWERYFYGETGVHDYTPVGMVARDDGVVSVVMQAKNVKVDQMKRYMTGDSDGVERSISEESNYVHMLHLNGRGVTLSGDSYLSGLGAEVYDVGSYSGGRILLAGHVYDYAVDPLKEIAQEKSLSGVPLQDPSQGVVLPDAELSDKAKQGLQKLRKKISAQKYDGENHINEESAKYKELTRNGWVAIADAPKAYNDPCEN